MKFIKGLFIALVSFFVIWIILAAFSLKTYEVKREILMDASPQQIWNHISTFEKWQSWLPWKEKDSTMYITYEGASVEVGSKMNWVGDPKIYGTGNVIISEVVINSKIGYVLQLKKNSPSTGYIEIIQEQGQSKIVCNDKRDLPFMMRPVTFLKLFDKRMGSDFMVGLEKLKSLAEASPKTEEVEFFE